MFYRWGDSHFCETAVVVVKVSTKWTVDQMNSFIICVDQMSVDQMNVRLIKAWQKYFQQIFLAISQPRYFFIGHLRGPIEIFIIGHWGGRLPIKIFLIGYRGGQLPIEIYVIVV